MLQRFQSSTMNMLFWYFYFSFFRVFCVAREYSGFCIGFSVIGKSRLYQKHRKGSQISTESCQSWNTEAKFGSFMTGDAKAWKKLSLNEQVSVEWQALFIWSCIRPFGVKGSNLNWMNCLNTLAGFWLWSLYMWDPDSKCQKLKQDQVFLQIVQWFHTRLHRFKISRLKATFTFTRQTWANWKRFINLQPTNPWLFHFSVNLLPRHFLAILS